jgi:hypothetical protein
MDREDHQWDRQSLSLSLRAIRLAVDPVGRRTGPGAAPESGIRSGRRVERSQENALAPGQDLLKISTP